MLAIATPPGSISTPGTTKGFTVETTENKKGMRVGGRKGLDAAPGAHQGIKFFRIALVIVSLKFTQRTAYSAVGQACHQRACICPVVVTGSWSVNRAAQGRSHPHNLSDRTDIVNP